MMDKILNSEELDEWIWHHAQVLQNVVDSVKDEKGKNIKWVDRVTGEFIDVVYGEGE